MFSIYFQKWVIQEIFYSTMISKKWGTRDLFVWKTWKTLLRKEDNKCIFLLKAILRLSVKKNYYIFSGNPNPLLFTISSKNLLCLFTPMNKWNKLQIISYSLNYLEINIYFISTCKMTRGWLWIIETFNNSRKSLK